MTQGNQGLSMSMKTIDLKLKLYPAPILRKKASPVNKVTSEERDILSKMAQMMYELKGVGLAANQVGLDKFMLVADAGNCLYKLINPQIIKRQRASEIMEEGCLSLPGINLKIRRAKAVSLKARDENGNPVVINAEGLLSRILQHEIDHLNGKLITERASLFKKMKIKRTLNALRKRVEDERMPQSEKEPRPL